MAHVEGSNTEVVRIRVDCHRLANSPLPIVREVCRIAWQQAQWPLQAMGYDEWQQLAELIMDERDVPINLPGDIRAGGKMGWLYWNRWVDDCLRPCRASSSFTAGICSPKLATEVASPSVVLRGLRFGLTASANRTYHTPPQIAQTRQIEVLVRLHQANDRTAHQLPLPPRTAAIFTRLVNFCWVIFQWGLFLAVAAALVVGGYLYFWLDDEILRQVQHRLASHYHGLQSASRKSPIRARPGHRHP